MTLAAAASRGVSLAVVLMLAVVSLVTGASAARAEDPPAISDGEIRFMRIGTGPTSGTYFPMGGLIANAISNPPGSRACDKGGSCGVPGLIAVAQSTQGAVANVDAIADGTMELALVQSDIAYWAYHGTGIYKTKGAVENLRAVARLYQEAFHLVVRKDAGITGVADLAGKRVSLGEQGSGTLVDALAIIEAHGLEQRDIKASFLKPGASADALLAGDIDAFFFVAGAPVTTISNLIEGGQVALVPITGPAADKLADSYPFLARGEIPAGAYPGVGAVPTITVGAVLVCDASLAEELVYGITRALWHPNTLDLIAKGYPGGGQLDPKTATKGLGIPLHAGAANYYFDAGLME